jgi:hypothetical protein
LSFFSPIFFGENIFEIITLAAASV